MTATDRQGGFGDGLNAYAHSMAWFNDRPYVDTTRGDFPFMKARLSIGMDIWPVECPANPFDLDMRAEIWRYDRRHGMKPSSAVPWRCPCGPGSNG